MQLQLNYRFKRRSKDFLDWLVNVVESNQYPDMESMIKHNIREHSVLGETY